MKNLLRLEEVAQFLVCLAILIGFNVEWWVYLLLLLGPDIGMLGYLINSRVGAVTYNVLHHKGLALVILLIGFFLVPYALTDTADGIAETLRLAGVILYGHASMDRIFGYGLKFGDNFHHTHLGWIGGKGSEAVKQ